VSDMRKELSKEIDRLFAKEFPEESRRDKGLERDALQWKKAVSYEAFLNQFSIKNELFQFQKARSSY
jgi:hypothetical protein